MIPNLPGSIPCALNSQTKRLFPIWPWTYCSANTFFPGNTADLVTTISVSYPFTLCDAFGGTNTCFGRVTKLIIRATMDAHLIKGLSVLVLQLFMLGIDNGHAQQSVTCDAGIAYIGESSNVTCYYHKDIGANKLSVNVAMVPTSPERDNEERDVIQCSWTKQDDKPQCLVAHGYMFNHKVTDRLTVEIPNTTAHFAGVYTCRIVPPDDATVDTCSLVVKEKTQNRCKPAMPSSQQGTPTVSDWERGALTTIIILNIVHIILILLLIGCFAWPRKDSIRKMLTRLGVDHATDDDSANQPQIMDQLNREMLAELCGEKKEEHATDNDPGNQHPNQAQKTRAIRRQKSDPYEYIADDQLDSRLSSPDPVRQLSDPPRQGFTTVIDIGAQLPPAASSAASAKQLHVHRSADNEGDKNRHAVPRINDEDKEPGEKAAFLETNAKYQTVT
ncbi:hypothetical protein V1264_016804 [Littorina saxatilis]|uniref:Ig-like domain-containing protein n=1 Tax=Littorina saxatilis TaxID=31220 RepID=A0AAN9GEI9_9CAEN